MRTAAAVLSVVLVLIGAVWFLQGIGILPGSFMSGQRQWAINGVIAFVIGVALMAFSRPRRPLP